MSSCLQSIPKAIPSVLKLLRSSKGKKLFTCQVYTSIASLSASMVVFLCVVRTTMASLDLAMELEILSSLFSSAYAGGFHSLFVKREGKVLACWRNEFGQLFLSSPGDNVYLPVETTITSGATFCIAIMNFSVIFIDGDPPPNTPNRPIDEGK